MGKIEAINITNIREKNTFYVNHAILEKGKGIVNDRYYGNFKEIFLKGAEVGNILALRVKNIQDFYLEGIHIKENLTLIRGSFGNLNLKYSTIDGEVNLSRSTFRGNFYLAHSIIKKII